MDAFTRRAYDHCIHDPGYLSLANTGVEQMTAAWFAQHRRPQKNPPENFHYFNQRDLGPDEAFVSAASYAFWVVAQIPPAKLRTIWQDRDEIKSLLYPLGHRRHLLSQMIQCVLTDEPNKDFWRTYNNEKATLPDRYAAFMQFVLDRVAQAVCVKGPHGPEKWKALATIAHEKRELERIEKGLTEGLDVAASLLGPREELADLVLSRPGVASPDAIRRLIRAWWLWRDAGSPVAAWVSPVELIPAGSPLREALLALKNDHPPVVAVPNTTPVAAQTDPFKLDWRSLFGATVSEGVTMDFSGDAVDKIMAGYAPEQMARVAPLAAGRTSPTQNRRNSP